MTEVEAQQFPQVQFSQQPGTQTPAAHSQISHTHESHEQFGALAEAFALAEQQLCATF